MSISDIEKKYRGTGRSNTLSKLAPAGRHNAKVTGWGGYFRPGPVWVYWITFDLEGGQPYLALAETKDRSGQIRTALEGIEHRLWRRQNYTAFLMHYMARYGSDREITDFEHMEFFVEQVIDPRQAAKVPPLIIGIEHIGVVYLRDHDHYIEVSPSQAEFEKNPEYYALVNFIHTQQDQKNILIEWKKIKKQKHSKN